MEHILLPAVADGPAANGWVRVGDLINLELHVDHYSAMCFDRLVTALFSSNTLRHLRIIRPATLEDRTRTSSQIQRLLLAVLGRVPRHGSEQTPCSVVPKALKTLRLDHVTKADINHLAPMLVAHPSLQELGLSLFPYRKRRVPRTLADALTHMPKLKSLKLNICSGRVLGVCNNSNATHTNVRRGRRTFFPKLEALEVSLPRSKQVISLTTQLATPASGLFLQELHLTTDAVVADVVDSIATLITETKTLDDLQLCFRSYFLDDSGCIVLAKALARNTTLLNVGFGPWLSLAVSAKIEGRDSSEGISRQGGCTALVEALKQNRTLENVTFQGQWPGEEKGDQADMDSTSGNVSETEHNLTDDEDEESVPSNQQDDDELATGGEEDDEAELSSISESSSTTRLLPYDPPSFVDTISFYLKLNRCGRGELMQNDTATKEEWINMLASQNPFVSRLFYFLRCNPSLVKDSCN